ncbi:MAG: hypothetical protein WCQ54_13405 [Clostridiaceae bacterium]
MLLENEKLFELMEKMYADLKGGQEKIYIDLKGGMDNMYAEMQDIKKDVKGNSNKIDNLEKIVLRMEQDHGQKLEALFDGYIQNSQKIDKIEKEVSKHEEVILRRIK